MATLNDQLEWEAECRRRGADKYYARQDVLREKGRTEQTDSFQYILHSRLAEVSETLETDLMSGNAGIQSKYNKLLNQVKEYGVSTHAMSFLGLQVVIKALAESKRKNANRVTRVCSSIGERLETEVRCMLFEKTDPDFYKKTHDLIKKNDIVSYDEKRRVMSRRLREIKTTISWSAQTRVGVGTRILNAIENVLQDIMFIEVIPAGRNKSVAIISTTEYFNDWCGDFEREAGLLEPALLPLKIAPLDWKADDLCGGYYTAQMQVRFPFIKTKGKEHREFVDSYTPLQHIQAVNKIQKTAWCINQRVLSTVEQVFQSGLGYGIPSQTPIEIPELHARLQEKDKDAYTEEDKADFKYWKTAAKSAYLEEIRRRAKVLQFLQTLNLARELKTWEEFYFAYSCDFRGRVYCATSALSPQSNDVARSLLIFKEEVELGTAGTAWLALRGANMFGIKGTYEERLEWIVNYGNKIAYMVNNDPVSCLTWTEADEPWQFLAWCFEWAKCKYGTDPKAKSSLVVGIDGSCNGLQHFSAILRDPVGAKATNLCASPVPQDVYQEVADKVIDEIRIREDGAAEVLLRVGIDRSTTKRQCMTLPYGATKQSCRDYTFEWVKDNWDKFGISKYEQWNFADYLATIIWDAIGKVVVLAREAMEWLQRNTGKRYARWISPAGFPVYQFYKKVKAERVNTKLAGGVRLTFHNLDNKGEPHLFKQRLGIVPNFIHSVDASHMVMTINGTELPAYSMIHDEFGCHAGHVQSLYEATRVQFYLLHDRCNPLELWATHQGIPLEYVPKRGSFDISEVLSSKYIFG